MRILVKFTDFNTEILIHRLILLYRRELMLRNS